MSKKTKDKKWTKEEDEFLIKHNDLPRKEVADLIGRTLSSVSNRYRILGLKRPRILINEKQEAWSEDDLQYLRDNYYNFSKKELAKKLRRTTSAIQNKANKLGLKKDKIQHFNKNYFDTIDSKEKAYWLGFIYADGWVECKKDNRGCCLGIELKREDYEHLEKFNNCLNGNVSVKFRKRQSCFDAKKIQEMCNIKFYSKKIVDSLSKYNIVPNKTYKKDGLPNIPKEYIISFLHGYFDGDGSFFCKNNYKNDKYYAINITSINKNILNEIREFLYNEYNIKSYIALSSNKGNYIAKEDIYQITICSVESLKKICKLFLEDNIYLDRKYKLIKDYIASLNE